MLQRMLTTGTACSTVQRCPALQPGGSIRHHHPGPLQAQSSLVP